MTDAIPLSEHGLERRPDIHKYTPDTKARVDRNFNESPHVRLYMTGKYDEGSDKAKAQDRYGIGIAYLETYYQAYPTQSHEYKARVDGGGQSLIEYCLSAEDRILRCGRLMDKRSYKAIQMLLVDGLEPKQISFSMSGVHGWGIRSINKRLCEVLDELSSVWPATKSS